MTWSEDPSKDIAWAIGLIISVALCLLIQRRDFPALLSRMMVMFKRRCAAVICVGLAILAGSLLLDLRADYEYKLWNDLYKAGWTAAFGAALTLVGVYHWLARPDIK
jgi:hypothetical protein